MAAAAAPVLDERAAWPHHFEIVPIRDMWIASYQRPPTSLVKEIVADYDPIEIGALLLSRRSKGRKHFAIIDGKTRWEAMTQVEEVEAPALVLEGMTEEQEADLFSKLQRKRRGITPYQRFNADIVAGSEVAIGMKRIVESQGFALVAQSGRWNEIKAVAFIESAYKESTERLKEMLSLVAQTWTDIPHATAEPMLRGIWLFLRDLPVELEEERFSDRLGRTTPSAIDDRARKLREGQGMHGTAPKYIAEVIQQIYRSTRK